MRYESAEISANARSDREEELQWPDLRYGNPCSASALASIRDESTSGFGLDDGLSPQLKPPISKMSRIPLSSNLSRYCVGAWRIAGWLIQNTHIRGLVDRTTDG